MAKYTNQEAFDLIVRHLAQQERQSVIGNTCVYRDGKGGKCAIGALISDAEFEAAGGKAINTASVKAIVPCIPRLSGVNVGLLWDLQGAHDCPWLREEYGETSRYMGFQSLRAIASQYGLDTSVVDEVETQRRREQEAAK